MRFGSDAALIRHYFKILMEDGKARTTRDVWEYVLRENGETGVHGDAIGRTKVYNALYAFLRPGGSDYVMPSRGVFVKKNAMADIEIGEEQPIQVTGAALEPVCDNVLRILKTAEAGIRNCFTECFRVMDITDDRVCVLCDTEREMISLFVQAVRLMKVFREDQGGAFTNTTDGGN